jgi:hypothetical protein
MHDTKYRLYLVLKLTLAGRTDPAAIAERSTRVDEAGQLEIAVLQLHDALTCCSQGAVTMPPRPSRSPQKVRQRLIAYRVLLPCLWLSSRYSKQACTR